MECGDSVRGDVYGLDDNRPFLNLALDKRLQISGRLPLGRDRIIAGFLQAGLYGRSTYRADGGIVEFSNDRRRRTLGHEKGLPG